jgi:hypothetical protein
MDESVAKTIIAAAGAVALIIWLAALRLYRRMAEMPRVERLEARISGKSPAEVIKSLVEGAAPAGGMTRLSRPSEHALVISQLAVEARIATTRAGGQTLVTADIDDSSLRRKFQIAMAILVVVIMPAVIVGVTAALWYLAAPSAVAAVRWQSLQVLQMSHALWPPFLVYFVWKKQREMVASMISNLLVRAETA